MPDTSGARKSKAEVLLLAAVRLSGEQVDKGELRRRLNLDFSATTKNYILHLR
jgi:hypothetical protein